MALPSLWRSGVESSGGAEVALAPGVGAGWGDGVRHRQGMALPPLWGLVQGVSGGCWGWTGTWGGVARGCWGNPAPTAVPSSNPHRQRIHACTDRGPITEPAQTAAGPCPADPRMHRPRSHHLTHTDSRGAMPRGSAHAPTAVPSPNPHRQPRGHAPRIRACTDRGPITEPAQTAAGPCPADPRMHRPRSHHRTRTDSRGAMPRGSAHAPTAVPSPDPHRRPRGHALRIHACTDGGPITGSAQTAAGPCPADPRMHRRRVGRRCRVSISRRRRR